MSALRTFFAAGLMAGSAAAVLVACSSFGAAPTEPVSDANATDSAVSPVGDAAVPPDAGLVDQSAPLDAGPADASVDANDGGLVVFTCGGWSVTGGTFMAGGGGGCVLCKNASSTNEALADLEIPVGPGRYELSAGVSSLGAPPPADGSARVGLVTQSGNSVPAERSISGPISPMSTTRGAEITVDTGGRLTARLGVSGTGGICAKFEQITLTRK